MKRILALPFLCLAVVLVPYFFSCDPGGGTGGGGGEGTPTTSPTATGQACEPLICDDPGDMTFNYQYAIGTTMEGFVGVSMTTNGCGLPVDASVEFSGDTGWTAVPQQQSIEPGATVDWGFEFDFDSLDAAGSVDSTAQITGTDGTHTDSCTYNLHIDVTQPQPMHIKVDDITTEWALGTDCSEPIGSGTVTNTTDAMGAGWTGFGNPDLFFSDPPQEVLIQAGETQEFFIFMDCLMLDAAGTQTSDFTLSADCAEGVFEETVQITVDVTE